MIWKKAFGIIFLTKKKNRKKVLKFDWYLHIYILKYRRGSYLCNPPSFSIIILCTVVVWCSVCVVVYWLVLRVFAITTNNMRKLIAIGFPMHWIRKVLTVWCLVHGWSLSTLDAAALAWIFVWATMIDSVVLLRHVGVMRWWSAEMIIVVVVHATVLDWVWCVHAVHDVGEVAGTIYCLADVRTVVHRWVGHWLACGVLHRCMTWIRLRMTCRRWRSWLILREVASTWLTLSCAWSMIRSTHVVLLATLWADSSKPSKSWWSFIMIVVMVIVIIMISRLSNRASVLCYLSVGV